MRPPGGSPARSLRMASTRRYLAALDALRDLREAADLVSATNAPEAPHWARHMLSGVFEMLAKPGGWRSR